MINVAIVEDQPLMRFALEEIFAEDPELALVKVYTHSRILLEEYLPLEVEVLVMDLGMPGVVDPVQVIRQIKTRRAEAKIIVYTSKDDPIYVQDCVNAGACGYLLKDEIGIELAQKIKDAQAGIRVFSPRIEDKVRISSTYRTLLFSEEDMTIMRLMAQNATHEEIMLAVHHSPFFLRRLVFVIGTRLGILIQNLNYEYEPTRLAIVKRAQEWQLIPEKI
jgi:DNA-binding NarL/FixJ family response regulator